MRWLPEEGSGWEWRSPSRTPARTSLAARTRSELEEAGELVQSMGRKVLILPADVSDVNAVRVMVDAAADHFGRLDILVNAAGINIRQPVDHFTEADWDRLMSVNLKGAFFASREAARRMRQQGKGKIINVGSVWCIGLTE